jgi:uncharacterized protein YkwD
MDRLRVSERLVDVSLRAACATTAVLLLLGAPTHAGPEDAANWARRQGCPAPAGQALRHVASLHQAALQMAAGFSLQNALTAVGYLAAQSAVVHISGALSDAEVGHILVGNYCKMLTDPVFRDVGVADRGRDLWLVLAAPVALPSARDAALINQRILDLVNQARAAGRRCGDLSYGAAPPLKLNASLSGAALAHSQEMATYGEFEHGGHDGSTPAQRVARAGYGAYQMVGENIAAGPTTAAEVTAGWLASAPHCQNIMEPGFSEIGIGFAVNTASSELIYWTQDFAAPRR